MDPLVVALVFLCIIGAGAVAIYMALYGDRRAIDERFADIAVKMRITQGVSEEEASDDLMEQVFRWAQKRIPPPDLDTPKGEKLSATLAQAGFIKSSAAHTYQVIRVLSGVALGAVGFLAGTAISENVGNGIIFGGAGAALGLFIPSYYVGSRARRRQNAIAKQLSDVLDLLIVCVEAGLGLYEAIKVVGTQAERQGQEIGTELALVSSEISAGASLGQALRSLAERTAVEDIRPLAATLIQSEQLGAQIAPALQASSDALRTRRRLRAEELAQKASIKILFPLVMFVLPAMIAVIVGPAMIQVLKTISL